MPKNQKKNSQPCMPSCAQELCVDEHKDFVDSSKFTKVTLVNQLFELLKNDDQQGKRSESRKKPLVFERL